MNNLLDFLKRTKRMAFIDRCANTPHIRPYSVAEHSYFIALFAMFFADLENERISSGHLVLEEDLYNIAEVVKRALLHDLEESETGDILYPLHHENSELTIALNNIRKKVVEERLFNGLSVIVRNGYIRLWKCSKDNSKEGRLVACMDKFEILMFAINELDMGNHAFRSLYDNAIKIIDAEFKIPTVMFVVNEIKILYK